MNRDTFFRLLRKKLKALKSAELLRNLSYYEEMISDMLENGFSEEEALARIGSPEQIAREILENASPDNFRRRDIPGRVLICLSALLLIFAIVDQLQAHTRTAASISIIGGADGPTSIFLAGKISTATFLYPLAGVMILITAIYYLVRRRRNSK